MPETRYRRRQHVSTPSPRVPHSTPPSRASTSRPNPIRKQLRCTCPVRAGDSLRVVLGLTAFTPPTLTQYVDIVPYAQHVSPDAFYKRLNNGEHGALNNRARQAAARSAQASAPVPLTPLTRPEPSAATIDPTVLRGGKRPIIATSTPLPSLRKPSWAAPAVVMNEFDFQSVATWATYAASLPAGIHSTVGASFASFPPDCCPAHTGAAPRATHSTSSALYSVCASGPAPVPQTSTSHLDDEFETQVQAMLDEAADPSHKHDEPSCVTSRESASAGGRASRSQASRAVVSTRGGVRAQGGATGGERSRKIKRSRSYTSFASARE